MSQVFFTSYAREDRRRSIQPIFDEVLDLLSDQVRAITGFDEEDIRFLDTSDIQTGDDWLRVLGDALRKCKVCVCFMSPTYFSRPFCGKEFTIFRRRWEEWKASHGKEGQPGRFIFPILWVIPQGGIPPIIADLLQYRHDALPECYQELGLLQLAQLKGERDNQMLVIQALARSIAATVADPTTPPLPVFDSLPSFDEIMDAFCAPYPYGIAILPIAEAGRAVRIDLGNQSLYSVVSAIGSSLRLPWRELSSGNELPRLLKESREACEALIVVIDLSRGQPPAIRQTLGALDDAKLECASFLLLVRDAEVPAGLNGPGAQEVLGGASPKSILAAAVADGRVVVSAPTDARVILEQLITRTREFFRGRDNVVMARDPKLDKTAEEQGIDTSRISTLVSPGAPASLL